MFYPPLYKYGSLVLQEMFRLFSKFPMVYIALSRATNLNNIYIAVDLSLFTTTTPSTANIVY